MRAASAGSEAGPVPDATPRWGRAPGLDAVHEPGVASDRGRSAASSVLDRARGVREAVRTQPRTNRTAVQDQAQAPVWVHGRISANGSGRIRVPVLARSRDPAESSQELLASSRIRSKQGRGGARHRPTARASPSESASHGIRCPVRSSSRWQRLPGCRQAQRPSRSAHRIPQRPQGACGRPSQTQDMNKSTRRVQAAPYGTPSGVFRRCRGRACRRRSRGG